MIQVTSEQIVALQDKILERYATHKRELPRRDTDDPYKVLVSEVMLQQTQVDRVVPKFERWVDELPTIGDLGEVDKPTLLTLWSGLGFNSRAIRLQQAAQQIVAEHDGCVPDQREQLLALPGIGPYSSASIMAFAYNLPAPVVDTNIRRVLIYELQLDEQIGSKELEQIALAAIPSGRSNDRHNALMDYGSLVATAQATGIKPRSKQSKFEGSQRQVRGRLLKYLLDHGCIERQKAQELFGHPAFDQIVAGMENDQIILIKKDVIIIDNR